MPEPSVPPSSEQSSGPMWVLVTGLTWVLMSEPMWKIDQKWFRGIVPGISLFRLLFDHTCTFYLRNTYKCQKQFLHFFFQKIKRIHPHLYDRFYNFEEKILMKKKV
jgi:hypothetical protein